MDGFLFIWKVSLHSIMLVWSCFFTVYVQSLSLIIFLYLSTGFCLVYRVTLHSLSIQYWLSLYFLCLYGLFFVVFIVVVVVIDGKSLYNWLTCHHSMTSFLFVHHTELCDDVIWDLMIFWGRITQIRVVLLVMMMFLLDIFVDF